MPGRLVSLLLLIMFAISNAPLAFAASNTISVAQYGAIPNDGVDDTAAMQRAADALCAQPGTTLRYPAGTYNVNQLVDYETEFSGLIADKSIIYRRCSNIKIIGPGAKIEVKGNFQKQVKSIAEGQAPPPLCHSATPPFELGPCRAVGEADFYQRVPFAFVEASNFVLSGFEIDGNVDQMTQSEPDVFLNERNEYGIWIIDSHDFLLQSLFVHHMANDGITFTSRPGSDRGKLDRVVSANNARTALTIAGPVQNLEIVSSELRDSGVLGTTFNSFPQHAPARGVNIETECLPLDADWGAEGLRLEDCRLTGNILFDRVRVTGNLGGQIAFAHGESSANITIRRSFLQNAIGRGGDVVNMGVAGGVVENSILDAQMGYVDPCFTVGESAQLTSPVFTAKLAELAADRSSVAKRIKRETRGFSSTLRGNTILGQNSLLVCHDALPFLTIEGNTFTGAQPATLADNSFYATFGYMYVIEGLNCVGEGGRNWAQDIRIARNSFSIPDSAPRKYDGMIVHCGSKTHLRSNRYITSVGNRTNPFRVRYDHVASAANDCFPTDGTIVPIHGPRREALGDPLDYPGFQPYPLSSAGCLNLSQ